MGQHAELFGEVPYITDTEAFCIPINPDGRTFCGDLDIRIDPQGQWFYNGGLISSKEMVCLFAAMIMADDDGRYWLVSPTEIGRIEVDDTPFIALEVFCAENTKNQNVSVVTNVDQIITIGPDTPLFMKPSPVSGAITPYVRDEHGLETRVRADVYSKLIDLGVVRKIENHNVFGLWSNGAFFPLGVPLSPPI